MEVELFVAEINSHVTNSNQFTVRIDRYSDSNDISLIFGLCEVWSEGFSNYVSCFCILEANLGKLLRCDYIYDETLVQEYHVIGEMKCAQEPFDEISNKCSKVIESKPGSMHKILGSNSLILEIRL